MWSRLTFPRYAVGVPGKEHRGNLSLHLIQLHSPIHLQLLRPAEEHTQIKQRTNQK